MILLDIAPIPEEWYERHRPKVQDTIDTLAAPVDQFADTVNTVGGDSHSAIWTIVVALLSLAICLFMAYFYRQNVIKKAVA
jgi:predicted PurR-regulated permease PerM